MREYRRGSHTVYEVQLHVSWVTKYRYDVLIGEVGLRLREVIRQVREANSSMMLRRQWELTISGCSTRYPKRSTAAY